MGHALPKTEYATASSLSSVASSFGPRLSLVRGGVPRSVDFDPGAKPQSAVATREITILCLILVGLQFLDFALTALGVSHLGIEAEGNPMIRGLMHLWGPLPALLSVKFLATLVIYLLFIVARQVKWIRAALRAVIALYLCAAILPWSGILLGTFFL